MKTAKPKKERKFSTSIQLSDRQLSILEEIVELKGKPSNSEVLREAFDFYVNSRFPQLLR